MPWTAVLEPEEWQALYGAIPFYAYPAYDTAHPTPGGPLD
jgi:hypothetical protein